MGIINYFFFCRRCFNQRSHLLMGQNIALACNDIIKGKEVNIYYSENIFHKNAEKKENCVVKHCQCHNVKHWSNLHTVLISLQFLWCPMVPLVSVVSVIPNQTILATLGKTDSSDTIGQHRFFRHHWAPQGACSIYYAQRCPSVSSIYGVQSAQSDL